jgi:transposase-like protein
MSVLTDLKTQGVEDILNTATYSLHGFIQTIHTVFNKNTPHVKLANELINRGHHV